MRGASGVFPWSAPRLPAVPVEAILLGLASALRPTGVAAIYALLGSRTPRRSLLTFLAAGFAFSVTVGVLVVLVLHNVTGFRRTATSGAIVNIVLGAAALGFAAGVWWERVAWRARTEQRAPSPWTARLHDPSVGMLVVAGIATHLPGLFYLAGLNSIAGARPGLIGSVLQVLVYNGLWYSTGAAALIAFLVRPDATRTTVELVRSWLRDHEREVVAGVCVVVGVYFLGTGLRELAG